MTALDLILVTVGALGLVVAALSEKIRHLPVSEPLLALVVGVLLGRHVTDVLSLPPLTVQHSHFHEGTRLLLAISVMAVALRYPFGHVRKRLGAVALLLVVAMPAMAAVSTALGWWILGVPLATALLIGTAATPTDPVLASSVVTGGPAERGLPSRDRELLSLESGANDGLALPLVIAALAVAAPLTATEAVTESLWQVFGAFGLGAAAGWLGGRAMRAGEEHGATSQGPQLLFTVVLALGTMGLSGLLKVDGVLAVFVAGLLFNLVSTGRDRASDLTIDEAVNRFAVLPLFVVLGAALPWEAWSRLGWQGPALAVAVLVLRRLPILLLLARPLRLRLPDALFLGWFGPVGVSALFYLTLEAKRHDIPEVVIAAGTLIVVVSTIAHGLTASPGRRLYQSVTARSD